MSVVVVDASVGLKWLTLFAKEQLVDRAKALLDRKTAGEISLIVPDLFWLEISSALCKMVRRNKCTVEESLRSLEEMQQLPLQTLPSIELIYFAQQVAIQYGRSVYDSLYLALARTSRSQLITADERLANAVATYLPVKWLGAI
ncbi:MAG: type II toxin-antitoxin system VapC family toxin [Acidobacteria bacterium]|nr:type II toxin-antitoxin system VapC family toxin [Acidobacteriota bacterium]